MPEADPEKLLKMLTAEMAMKQKRPSTGVDRTKFRLWSLAAIVIASIGAIVCLQMMLASLRPPQESDDPVPTEAAATLEP